MQWGGASRMRSAPESYISVLPSAPPSLKVRAKLVHCIVGGLCCQIRIDVTLDVTILKIVRHWHVYVEVRNCGHAESRGVLP